MRQNKALLGTSDITGVLIVFPLIKPNCVQGLATSFGVMVAARIGMGLGQAAAETLTISLIPDLVPPEQVSVCESFFYTAIYLGAALGGGISTVFTALSVSWRWAFIGVGAFGVLLGGLFAILVREPDKGAYLVKDEVRTPAYRACSSTRGVVGRLLTKCWVEDFDHGVMTVEGPFHLVLCIMTSCWHRRLL